MPSVTVTIWPNGVVKEPVAPTPTVTLPVLMKFPSTEVVDEMSMALPFTSIFPDCFIRSSHSADVPKLWNTTKSSVECDNVCLDT